MEDVHTLQMNNAKGQLESVVQQLKEQKLVAMKDKHVKVRAVVIARLEGIIADLGEVVTMAGEVSIKPIPFEKNTAWEVAKAMVDFHSTVGGAE
jgi:hypothetical protein